MKKALWGVLAALFFLSVHTTPAAAQATVIATCGSVTVPLGTGHPLTEDTTGTLCATGGGGGGGGAVTAAAGSYATGYSSDFGTLISPNAASLLGLTTAIKALITTTNTLLAQSIPAGSALIGHIISDAGSVSAITGNVGGLETSGSAVTGNGVRVMGKAGSNTAQDLGVGGDGSLFNPQIGAGPRIITKTNLAANTSTTVCPANTALDAEEIIFTTANVGISFHGGALTQATYGTTADTQPDFVATVANTIYTFPVAATNAITAYGAAGIVVCIQSQRP